MVSAKKTSHHNHSSHSLNPYYVVQTHDQCLVAGFDLEKIDFFYIFFVMSHFITKNDFLSRNYIHCFKKNTTNRE